MKVYCRDCTCWNWGEREDIVCLHPNNMRDSFYKRKSIPILSAEVKNKNNDCPDYIDAKLEESKERLKEGSEKLSKRRWWKFWTW